MQNSLVSLVKMAMSSITDSVSRKKRSSNTKRGYNEEKDGPSLEWKKIKHLPLSFLFVLLVIARIFAATFSIITDCDETFNYWEPMHYLIHGSGMQTWEYSPMYALRSYAYLWLHAFPVMLMSIITSDKVVQFYSLRSLLALICAVCEVYFYRGVCKQFGYNTARICILFLIFSPAMFISSTAFLPSSFTMYLTMVAMSAWFLNNEKIAVMAVAASSIVGWPFAGIIGVPVAYDLLIRKRMFQIFAKWSFISLAVFLAPVIGVDTYYYGRLVVAPFNIILYNIFGGHGPNLYGVSPMSYYFINGFLNFNVAFVLALISLPLWVLVIRKLRLTDTRIPVWLTLLPLYIWVAIFFTRPHKEERFLFPIYPLFALAAALSLDCVQKLYAWLFPRSCSSHYTMNSNWLFNMTISLFFVLSLSRSVALYKAYHAPLNIYHALYKMRDYDPTIFKNNAVNICVGKEWHRFPTSFFLPNMNVHLQFIKSDFKGQLPRAYEARRDATRVVPAHMNNMNLEESSRYVNISHCNYLVDLASSDISPLQPDYSSHTQQWTIIHSHAFLDASRSHRLFRAFYVPGLSETYTVYTQYNLLKMRPQLWHKHRH